MYVYIWFEKSGWSHDPPTEEDRRSIDSGQLHVLRLPGTDLPPVDQDTLEPVDECQVDTTPDGAEYHYVP